ncbi:MAG: SurA N-terminal domain-containing protein [Gammaproteobacteria bacterium]|nr:SurA N-terminal domain-containing protein [Gammaproteobacteria bacterium]
MLQKIRERISGPFAIFFLGAIAVVFIFWGVQFESAVNSAAATVNGKDISQEAVRRAWQERQTELQTQRRDELPPELVKSEQARLLDDFIARELLVQRAHESGYRVSDRELAESITRIPALQVDGKFSRDRYAALLRQQGRTEPEFEQEYRRDLETSQLTNAIALSSFVTPGELRRRVELQGEMRDAAYAVVPAAGFAAQVQVTPAEITAYYDKNKSQFMSQEKVALQYLQLNLADIAAGVQVTEDALKKYYDETAAERNAVPERRKAAHILIETGSDDAAASKKADAILARAKAGEDFAKLAQENSDDPGSKAAGGDLGWAPKEAYVQPFSEALFAMKKGEIRGPVKTQFGYHIIRLEDIEEPHVRSFDEVRTELEPEFRRDQAQALFYEKSQQLADESFASLSELDSVAKKLGMTVQTVDGFTRQGGGALGNDRKVIEAAFSNEVLQERQNSPPLQIGEESVVVLRVTDHQPSMQLPLAQVQEQIVTRLREDKARAAATGAATALAKRVNTGEPLATAAASVGSTAVASPSLSRRGPTVEGAAPMVPELLQAIFKAPRPAGAGKVSAGVATLASGDPAVFVVSSATPGTPAVFGGDLAEQARNLATQNASIEFDAYLAELRRTAKIKRNDKMFAAE